MSAVLEALTQVGRETARIVLHAPCVVCDRELPWRDRKASCCAECWATLPRIMSAKCTSCAMPLAGAPLCIACFEDPLPVQWTEAWGHYRTSLERLLHAFKFARHDFLDVPLAGLLATVLRDRDFDAVVPIPMHRSKVRTRGYNQAELLARALAKLIGVPCDLLLARTRAGQAQSKLARKDRAANVRGAFAAKNVKDRAILLVDDVCTTGETLRASAQTLQRAGASRVCAVVVAKA